MNYSAIRKRFLAVSAAALLGTCAGIPMPEGSGAGSADSAITGRIRSALRHDRKIRDSAIGVETVKGKVQLSGFARTTAERARAANLARAVPGVKRVSNNIHLA